MSFNLSPIAAPELTRPSDTTAYAARDVIADATSGATLGALTGVAGAPMRGGYIVKARLMTDQKTCTARFRVHLYHTAPTQIEDNSPYLLLYADAAKRVGMIDFPAMATEDATNSTAAQALAVGSAAYLPLAFRCAADSQNLRYMIETLDAFTPASGQKFHLELTVEQG